MTQGVDAALTITGFVIVAPFVLVAMMRAPFTRPKTRSAKRAPPTGVVRALVMTATAVPTVLAVAVYVAAILLTGKAVGPTFHYPWIALAVGAGLWFATALALGFVVNRLR